MYFCLLVCLRTSLKYQLMKLVLLILYIFVSLPGYTWQCGLIYTDIKLRTISSVMGDRYVKSDDNKKILCAVANNLYGHSMSQLLPFESKFDKYGKLEDILNTPDDNDLEYFIEVGLT